MKNNKRAIVVVSCIAVFIIAGIAIILGAAFGESEPIVLKASDGTPFASVSWDGYDIIYTVNNQYEEEYARYAIDEVENILIAQGMTDENNADKYIFKNVTEINTNYDAKTQKLIKTAYDKNVRLHNSECAIAITDLKGKLVAVFSNGKNEAISLNKTYAGSTLKPLSVYAPAIDSGRFNWSYTVADEPVKKVMNEDGGFSDWPTNSDNRYSYEDICLANAIAFSTNTVAVKTLQEYGVKESVAILEDIYGINVDFEKNKMNSVNEDEILGNIALGYLYNGVSVADMAGYYQVFGNGGKYTAPAAVDGILDEDGFIYKREYTAVQAMKPETACIMNRLLDRVVSIGTGSKADLDNVKVVGKTGTTSGNADNWFVGVTPEYSCAVWHSAIEDGNICPEIFGSIFENIESTVEDFPYSGKIEAKIYCEKSGLLSGENCIYCNKGYYLKTENLAQCEICE